MNFLLGVASVINHTSELFAYFFLHELIHRFGHIKILYLGLVGNFVRFVYISIITNPWWVLPFEFIQGNLDGKKTTTLIKRILLIFQGLHTLLSGQQLVRTYHKQHRIIYEYLVKVFFKVFILVLDEVVELYSEDFLLHISVLTLPFVLME